QGQQWPGQRAKDLCAAQERGVSLAHAQARWRGSLRCERSAPSGVLGDAAGGRVSGDSRRGAEDPLDERDEVLEGPGRYHEPADRLRRREAGCARGVAGEGSVHRTELTDLWTAQWCPKVGREAD